MSPVLSGVSAEIYAFLFVFVLFRHLASDCHK